MALEENLLSEIRNENVYSRSDLIHMDLVEENLEGYGGQGRYLSCMYLLFLLFGPQVFRFGSVPLKTYLPDGDIDLTAFGNNESSKDTWANEVRDMLTSEEKNENAEFCVKEVQYIQAEVSQT